MTAVQLYWWNDEPNFGDILSKTVVEFLSKRNVEWSCPENADIFAVGSLLNIIRKKYTRKQDHSPYIWGTGLSAPLTDTDFVENIRVTAIRGPLTEKALGIHCGVYGDPALLLPMIMPCEWRPEYIGILTHWQYPLEAKTAAKITAHPEFKLINVMREPHEVIHDICQCRYIFSSSLHGLIVADAYGIGNTWLQRPDHRLPRAQFKFLDYYASVGREIISIPPQRVSVENLLKIETRFSEKARPNVVDDLQKMLISAFPL